MAADGASGIAAVGFGIKSGIAAGAIAALVSLLATVIGFTVVPLTPGRELLDASRRLGAGLLSSFTLGPIAAVHVIEHWPNYLSTVITLIGGAPELLPWAYLTAATPFIALAGIVGFWVVAALMRFFTKRESKDVLEIARDVRDTLKGE